MIKEELGNVTDLHESFNGNQGTIVYLIDRDYNKLVEEYHAIKQAKAIISAYAIGTKHCLVLNVGGIVKKKVVKNKNKSKE